MKKEDLIEAVGAVRKRLVTDQILELRGFDSPEIAMLIGTVTQMYVAGIGEFARFDPLLKGVSVRLRLQEFYESGNFLPLLDELQDAKAHQDQRYRSRPLILRFFEAHQRVACLDDLLRSTLAREASEGELVIEGIGESDNAEPALADLLLVLRTLSELVETYREITDPAATYHVSVSYLDLGSNYQVGIKVDGKAEVGPNLCKLLTEVFKWITNPRAYSRMRRGDEVQNHVEVLAALQARVNLGEITPQAAGLLADRLLGSARTLSSLKAFPAPFVKERAEGAPVGELMKLLSDGHEPLALGSPNFGPDPSEAPGTTNQQSK